MRIDLKKVSVEIMDAEAMLAAIDHDIEECRARYFEHPWIWSEMRRTLTFDRHRVQRRLEELAFVRRCVSGRLRRSAAKLSFHSLADLGERNAKGLEHPDQVTFDVQPQRPTLQAIQGGRS